MKNIKRTIKKRLTLKGDIKISTYLASVFMLAIAFIMFLAVQLGTNAILSPLGHELQAINTERNILVEENRRLEKKIAINSSITVVEKFSTDKFELSEEADSNIVYIDGNELSAYNN